MKGTQSLLLTLIVLLTARVSASAYLEDYSPFTKSKPKSFPLRRLDVIEKRDDRVAFGIVRNGRSTTLLKLAETGSGDSYFSVLSIYDASGRLLKDSVKVSDSPHWQEAYLADLNRDGKNDYVIEIGSVATGLGTFENFIVCALSAGKTYEVITLHNWDSDSVLHDFVDLKANGRCQFIHTSLAYAKDNKGRMHSHWIYNLLEFRGTKVILANHLSSLFPKWVWYTDKPNRKVSPFVSRAEAIKWSKYEYQSLFWNGRHRE